MGNQKVGWKVRSWRRSSTSYTCLPPAFSPAPPQESLVAFSPHPHDGKKTVQFGSSYPSESPSRTHLRSPASILRPSRDIVGEARPQSQACTPAPALVPLPKRSSTAFTPPKISLLPKFRYSPVDPPKSAFAPLPPVPTTASAASFNDRMRFQGDSHFFRSRKAMLPEATDARQRRLYFDDPQFRVSHSG